MQAPDLDELVAGPIALVVLDEASICAAGFMAMFLIRVRPYLTEDCELLLLETPLNAPQMATDILR